MTGLIRLVALVLFAILASGSSGLAQVPEQRAAPAELRQMYFAAVDQEHAIAEGLALIERLERGDGPASVEASLLEAYEGALITLRAKHGFWPHARLRNLRDGLRRLDAAVDSRPEHVEIRFLRLLSCYYLPGILGRDWSVREDVAELARQLPAAVSAYPPDLYETMVQFILDDGRLHEREAAPLRQVLGETGDG